MRSIGAPYSEMRYRTATSICADCLEHSKRVLPDWTPNALTISGVPVVTLGYCYVCEQPNKRIAKVQPATELNS